MSKMEKTVSINICVPAWVTEEEIEKIVKEIEHRLSKRMPADEMRKMLGIREDELTYDIETINIEELEEKEKNKRNPVLYRDDRHNLNGYIPSIVTPNIEDR